MLVSYDGDGWMMWSSGHLPGMPESSSCSPFSGAEVDSLWLCSAYRSVIDSVSAPPLSRTEETVIVAIFTPTQDCAPSSGRNYFHFVVLLLREPPLVLLAACPPPTQGIRWHCHVCWKEGQVWERVRGRQRGFGIWTGKWSGAFYGRSDNN